ncbi:SDR family oxidoreductase [Bacillus swezeyi]|uniref:Sugar epimerase n=1 Tax=Bacillus swezeyi TaxID=1925020 RepID=A0A1R1RIN2_9BACI|nr:SDR family oxidoreductase [Bacillus swezeyi]MEC1259841.1 SDR family oxidoreductase [Bacillus swezeyi]MED2930047.1 SDR family oxidoreductase [Bacillus swezeyi]MED2963064.1 SDR family oxidoreductase [Bacillus swezeyi]MED3074272.1 SDR family oxidoreductase [Bacillus swezeyi]MED3083522.1 SDR family oxidoreductase [Bacillus swezeyi]
MKVFIVGANGQIGRFLTKWLSESSDHQVRAMVRNEEQAEALKQTGIETALANLEGMVENIAEAAKGCDAIVFTAGSGGKTGDDKTLLVDLDGAAKTIEAAEKAGIKRFIMISTLQAHRRENWNEALKPYYVAKHYADRILEDSDLTYTIIRPGGLLNEPGTGKVKAAENLESRMIPREDVAKTAAAVLTEEHTFRRSFDLTSGDTAIAEAIKTI